MAETEDAGSDISELLTALRERVEQRRADGIYPPGLEKDLDAHFERIVAQRVEANIDEVVEALGKLEHSMNFAMERIPADSAGVGVASRAGSAAVSVAIRSVIVPPARSWA